MAVDPRRAVVFTDLDGTLLDHSTYDYSPAEPALQFLRERAVPIVPVSSKTAAEIDEWCDRLALTGPFVTENGSAIVVPEGYFDAPIELPPTPDRAGLAEAVMALRKAGSFDFETFSEMGVDGIMANTGLDRQQARAANARHSSEPLLWRSGDSAYREFGKLVQARGLTCVRGGRFVHLMGQTSKGMALRALMDAFGRQGRNVSISLGDGPNDASMLDAADVAVLIPGVRSHNVQLERDTVIHAEQPGPGGWNAAIFAIFGIQKGNEHG